MTLLLTHSADPNPCCRDLFGASGPSPLHLAGGSAFELWPGSSSVATVATTRWQRQHCGSKSSGRDSTGEDINGARCAMLLLDAGASVHAVDMSTGRTPLHYAALQRNPALCACLVRAGAWLQVLDAGGETPISLAQQGRSKRPASSTKSTDAGEWRTTATDQEMAAAALTAGVEMAPSRSYTVAWTRQGRHHVSGGHREQRRGAAIAAAPPQPRCRAADRTVHSAESCSPGTASPLRYKRFTAVSPARWT